MNRKIIVRGLVWPLVVLLLRSAHNDVAAQVLTSSVVAQPATTEFELTLLPVQAPAPVTLVTTNRPVVGSTLSVTNLPPARTTDEQRAVDQVTNPQAHRPPITADQELAARQITNPRAYQKVSTPEEEIAIQLILNPPRRLPTAPLPGSK